MKTLGVFAGFRLGRSVRVASLLSHAALFCALSAGLSRAKPIIFSEPFTASPGDIISLEGKGFGSAPQVSLKAVHQSGRTIVQTLRGQDNNVVFEVPKTLPFDVYQISISDGAASSSAVCLNMPRAMHFDMPEVASGTRFRIFGRNLFIAPTPATVTLVDTVSKTSLAASVVLDASDAYGLTVIAPDSIVPGRTYKVVVANGFGTATADKILLGRAAGDDPFQLGLPWGADFMAQDGPGYQAGVPGTNENDHHVFDVTSDPDLPLHATGDGVTDDTAAIQAAIDLAAKNGGVAYLPAGTYRLAGLSGGLTLRSHVVLQGHSASDTRIVFGPQDPQPSSYMLVGIWWPANTHQSGLADISLVNIDQTSQHVVNALATGPASELFIQRVDWDLGSGQSIFLYNVNKLAIENSKIHQAINSQNPEPSGNSGIGPIYFGPVRNAIIQNNVISWASGENLILDVESSVIEANHFTRRASDQIIAGPDNLGFAGGDQTVSVGETIQRTEGRQLSINFGKNIVLQDNIFDVSDGVLKYNWYDGETILSEGGGPFPRADAGVVTWFGPNTVTDDSRCQGCSWNLYPNSMIQLVSGKGSGQLRHITGIANNTFTVDRPWDIQPAIGDHFAIFVQSFENTLIRNNNMQQNPAGIVLYDGSFLNISIVNNNLFDNGGIYLRGSQQYPNGAPTPHFSTIRNVEINNNILQDSAGLFPSYIVANFAMIAPNSIWGNSFDQVSIRNNSITANPGTPTYLYPEGYMNALYYQNPYASYQESGIAAIIGSIFQGNTCVNCPTDYAVDTGVDNTVIWNSINTDNSGAQSTVLSDQKIWNTATHGATGTLMGHD
jgi:parallel beta-helix repeat protein